MPIFDDNYIWLLDDGRSALAIDPGEAPTLLSALAQRGLSLAAVLITHHHHDHVGGLEVLCAEFPDLAVYGPARVARVNRPLAGGERIRELAIDWQVMAVPGHTLDHVAYYSAPWLFCGDTLFAAGCGRLFEGSPAQMLHSLADLSALPGDTLVCCTHEYTLVNEAFALQCEPANTALQQRALFDQARRAAGQPTLPSTIELERATNPFLRAGLLADASKGESELDAFTRLRAARNTFRPSAR
ncbi:hydroxyacylglutathione hydrolase [Chitinibacteraceae bacterium HSL-7]